MLPLYYVPGSPGLLRWSIPADSHGMQASGIAALATALSQVSLLSQVATAVAAKSLDAQRAQGQGILKLLDVNIGQNVNASA